MKGRGGEGDERGEEERSERSGGHKEVRKNITITNSEGVCYIKLLYISALYLTPTVPNIKSHLS